MILSDEAKVPKWEALDEEVAPALADACDRNGDVVYDCLKELHDGGLEVPEVCHRHHQHND